MLRETAAPASGFPFASVNVAVRVWGVPIWSGPALAGDSASWAPVYTGVTVSVAALEVTLPAAFENTARYANPLWPSELAAIDSVLEVCPPAVSVETLSVDRSPMSVLVHVEPPSFETCQITPADGFAAATAVNDTGWPALTAWFVGCAPTGPTQSTVNIAALLVATPAALVNRARY